MATTDLVKALPALAALGPNADLAAIVQELADDLLDARHENELLVAQMIAMRDSSYQTRDRVALDRAFGIEGYQIHVIGDEDYGQDQYAVTAGSDHYVRYDEWHNTLEAAAIACLRKHASKRRTQEEPALTADEMDAVADNLAGEGDTILADADVAVLEHTS